MCSDPVTTHKKYCLSMNATALYILLQFGISLQKVLATYTVGLFLLVKRAPPELSLKVKLPIDDRQVIKWSVGKEHMAKVKGRP